MRALSRDAEKWLDKHGVILGDSGERDGDQRFLNPGHQPT